MMYLRFSSKVTKVVVLLGLVLFVFPSTLLMQDEIVIDPFEDNLYTLQEKFGQPLAGGEYSHIEDAAPQENCALGSLGFSGQKHAISGTTGGFTFNDPASIPVLDGGIPGGVPISPEEIGAAWQGNFEEITPVAILIVDDFSGIDLSELDQLQLDLNDRTISLEDADRMLDAYSHGGLVEDHLKRIVGATNTSNITLFPVNVADYNTARITNGIKAAIVRLHSENGITRFVVNMSFAVVPCAVAKDYKASGINTFDDYISEIEARNPDLAANLNILHEDLVHILINPVDGDDSLLDLTTQRCLYPMELAVEEEEINAVAYQPDLINEVEPAELVSDFSVDLSGFELVCGGDEVEVIYVAASGNFGFSYPFIPAGWEFVVGVGASATEAGLPDWSLSNKPHDNYLNLTEAYEPGAWFEYDHRGVYYAGTSFAAPIRAVRIALDLMSR